MTVLVAVSMTDVVGPLVGGVDRRAVGGWMARLERHLPDVDGASVTVLVPRSTT